MNDYIGIIKIFGGNFAPSGWLFCNGALLPIAEYETLFVLIGTQFGGDGVTTFALPDLRGRLPISSGTGTGLSNYVQAQVGGSEQVTLVTPNIPSHTHALNVANTKADIHNPESSNSIGAPVDINGDSVSGFSTAAANTQLSPVSISQTGGNQAHDNLAPYLAVNYIICYLGVFPSRN